jgi:hypothetical protein
MDRIAGGGVGAGGTRKTAFARASCPASPRDCARRPQTELERGAGVRRALAVAVGHGLIPRGDGGDRFFRHRAFLSGTHAFAPVDLRRSLAVRPNRGRGHDSGAARPIVQAPHRHPLRGTFDRSAHEDCDMGVRGYGNPRKLGLPHRNRVGGLRHRRHRWRRKRLWRTSLVAFR